MGRINKLFFVLVAVALLILAVQPVGAQTTKGSISGLVVDQSGAGVPQATVTVTNRATGEKASAATGEEGSFRVNLLTTGSYEVEISKHGFKKLKLTSVAVDPSVDHALGTVKLELGEMTSTVEVTAAPPLIQEAQAQITSSITGEQLQTFAGITDNEGLDFLALQIPGVVNSRDNNFSNTNGVGFSVNGLRGRNNDQQIDGQNNNDNSVAGPGLFLSNVDFVQEYQITTNNFGPEYGRNSGSVVNIVTKSGTNLWHGTVSATETNSVLTTLTNTQKFFDKLTKVPRFNNEFTGATLGGPVWKDHVFLFGGFDDQIISSNGVFSTGSLTPTPKGIGQMSACYPGSKSVAALQAFGPYAIAGGPTSNGPLVTQKLTGAAVPNDGTFCDVQMSGVQRLLGNSFHEYDWVYKMDVVLNQADRFSGRYVFQKQLSLNTDAFATAAAGYPANVPASSQSFLGDWSHTFSSNTLNEFRLSFSRLNVEFGGNSVGNTIPNQGNVASALASITFNDPSLLGYGPATNAPQGRIVNTWQLQDNFNFTHGRHTLKAGVNFTFQRSPNTFLPNLNGSFRFSNWSTYAQDVPNRVQVASGNANLDFREYDTFLYAGDDWKIKSNLTLNLGLTWSYYGQPANLFHDRTVKQQASSQPFWNPALAASVTTFPTIPTVKSSFGPSIGFAWTPGGGWLMGNGKTVIRGGYRLSYDPPFYNIYLNISSASPQVLLQSLTGANAVANPMSAVPTGPNNRLQLASFLKFGVSDPRSFNETTITPNFGPDRVHSWSLGVQRELGAGAAFEARYVGNHGQNLFQSINGNPNIAGLAATFPTLVPSGVTPCSAANAVVPTAVGRVNCALGVQRVRTNTGYSDYNALQTELRTSHLWNQLTMRTGYTWSKTTDNVSEIFGTFGGGNTLAFSQNSLNFTSAEHALSGLNVPQSWTIGFVEDIPAFRSQHGVLGHLLGGWAISGSYILQSGQPYTPSQVFFNFFTGGVANDTAFNASFAGTDDLSRPFIGNPNAPVTSIGVLAGDACGYFGACTTSLTNPNALLDFTVLNTGGAETPISKNAVRYIMNGGQANTLFGTPFGNVARNSVNDAITNSGNFTLFKNIKFGERATLQFHMSMLNVFNHPNFSSVDPFLEDAGDNRKDDGFGVPSLFSGGIPAAGGQGREIIFGLKVVF